MNELQHGCITMQLPEGISLAAGAGKLDTTEVSRIPRVPQGIGRVCEHTADAFEKAQGMLNLPVGVTPTTLREVGQKAEKIDQVIRDAEVIISRLKQTSLIYKAEAYDQVLRANDVVRAYGKHNSEIWTIFALLREFFTKIRGGRRKPTQPQVIVAPTPTTPQPAPSTGPTVPVTK